MSIRKSTRIQAAALSLALLLPAGSAFAFSNSQVMKRNGAVYHRTAYRKAAPSRSYQRTTYGHATPVYHRHHYSQARGAVIGAVAGAVVDHKHPLTGALIGGALGEAVQYERNKHEKH